MIYEVRKQRRSRGAETVNGPLIASLRAAAHEAGASEPWCAMALSAEESRMFCFRLEDIARRAGCVMRMRWSWSGDARDGIVLKEWSNGRTTVLETEWHNWTPVRIIVG